MATAAIWIIATNESAAKGNKHIVFFLVFLNPLGVSVLACVCVCLRRCRWEAPTFSCASVAQRGAHTAGACFFILFLFTTTKIGIRYGGVWHPSSVSQGLHDVEFSLQVHVLLFGVKLFALRQLRPHLGGSHVQSRRTVVARTLPKTHTETKMTSVT
jgi:hypothetical protein